MNIQQPAYCPACGERNCICADSDFYRNGVDQDPDFGMCGYNPRNGFCDNAGSEHCEFDCPFGHAFSIRRLRNAS